MNIYFHCILVLPFLGTSIRLGTSMRLATDLSQSSKRSRPTRCDFPVGTQEIKMALDESSGQYKPFSELANATSPLTFQVGRGIKNANEILEVRHLSCFTHCTVLDYTNLPPRSNYWQKSCKNSFLHMFGKEVLDSSGHELIEQTKKVSKLKADDSDRFKLCCALEAIHPHIDQEGHAEIRSSRSSRPAIRTISWREDDFAAYGVVDDDQVGRWFLSNLHNLVQIWKTSEEAYLSKMREIWQQADNIQASSATLLLTRKNPWKVHVWWVGDSRAKVLKGEASIESHLCSKEIADSLSLKRVHSVFGWNCCNKGQSSCTPLSRSFGGRSRLPGILAEPDFADWTSRVTPGSVVAIASSTVWDAPLNYVLFEHASEIAKAYNGKQTTDRIAVVAANDWKKKIRPFTETALLKGPSLAKEDELITSPILKAVTEGNLQSTLKNIVATSQKLKKNIDNWARTRSPAQDNVIVVATLTD